MTVCSVISVCALIKFILRHLISSPVYLFLLFSILCLSPFFYLLILLDYFFILTQVLLPVQLWMINKASYVKLCLGNTCFHKNASWTNPFDDHWTSWRSLFFITVSWFSHSDSSAATATADESSSTCFTFTCISLPSSFNYLVPTNWCSLLCSYTTCTCSVWCEVHLLLDCLIQDQKTQF